jgi:SNF2 family DNA or RNA helicase
MSLFPHQEKVLKQIRNSKLQGHIIALQMGMGKTRIALNLLGSKSLIVCKKSNINVWLKEIKSINLPKTVYIHHKDYSNRLPSNQCDINIITYDQLRKEFDIADPTCLILRPSNYQQPLTRVFKPSCKTAKNYKISDVVKTENTAKYNIFYSTSWDTIIADESQHFSCPTSKIYMAMVALRSKKYYCISGTPITNYASDLYSQFKFMGLKCSPKDWSLDFYKDNKLSESIISMTFKDTDIQLPECRMINIPIKFNDIEKQMYNKTIDKLEESYKEFQQGLETFAAPLAMLTRLRQICLNPYIITDKSKGGNSDYTDFFENELDDELNKRSTSQWTKTRKILKIVRTSVRKNIKIVVFSSFVSFLNVLKDKIQRKNIGSCLQLDGSTKNRDAIVDQFNNSSANILLCSYKAGGVGINLTSAQAMILCEPWWNSAIERQAICRIHRIGQTKPVTIFSMVVENSVEMHLLKIQERKNDKIKEYGLEANEEYSRITGSFSKEIIESIVYGEYMV